MVSASGLANKRHRQAEALEVCVPLAGTSMLVSLTDARFAGGAKGDGSTDDTAAFAAAGQGGGHIRVPYTGQPFKCGPVVFDKPTVLDFEAGAQVRPLFGTSGAETLFRFQQPNSGLIRPKIVGLGAVTVSGSKTLIYATAGAVGFTVDEPDISNCQWSDGNHGLTNLIRTNAIYSLADGTKIRGGKLDTIMGPGIFAASLNGLLVKGVKFKDCAWYNLNLDENVSDFDIDGCIFDSSGVAYGVYWGGHINIMSQPTSPAPLVVRDGRVHGCSFTGLMGYGAVVRVQSGNRITIDRNSFHGIDAGSGAAGLPCSTSASTGAMPARRRTRTTAPGRRSTCSTTRRSRIRASTNSSTPSARKSAQRERL
jgi:hypothetical protein